MILDRKFLGILDQGKGTLIVYDNEADNTNFQRGLEVIGNMNLVVDAMSSRGSRLTQLKMNNAKGGDVGQKEKGGDEEVKGEIKDSSPKK